MCCAKDPTWNSVAESFLPCFRHHFFKNKIKWNNHGITWNKENSRKLITIYWRCPPATGQWPDVVLQRIQHEIQWQEFFLHVSSTIVKRWNKVE
jgi:hypothetical protein